MIRIHQRVARLSWKHWGVCLTRLNWITGDHYDYDHDCHDCDDGNHDYRDDHEGVVIMVIMIIIMNWVNLWQTSFGLSCLVFLPHFFLSPSFPSFFSFLNISSSSHLRGKMAELRGMWRQQVSIMIMIFIIIIIITIMIMIFFFIIIITSVIISY